MSLVGALLARPPGNSSGTAAVITGAPVKCSKQPVPLAAGKQKSLSVRLLIDLFTAGIAIRPVNHVIKIKTRDEAKGGQYVPPFLYLFLHIYWLLVKTTRPCFISLSWLR